MITSKQLQKHLKEEHKISPLSTYLKEIVYGGNDGIITTFAVVAGFAGAQNSSQVPTFPFFTVLLFGLANLFADATSMGLGNFLSVRSNQDVYRAEKEKELHEIKNNRAMEIAETKEILIMKGFTSQQAEKITTLYVGNENYWLEFMMSDELAIPNPEGEKPAITALITAGSFVAFGAIPLIPYVFFGQYQNVFLFSLLFTFLALLLLGVVRWRVTKENIFRSIGEIICIGGISALVAYFVGTFFRI